MLHGGSLKYSLFMAFWLGIIILFSNRINWIYLHLKYPGLITSRSLIADPRQWTEEHVIYWLNWATKEFSLECMNIEPFSKMRGRDMIALGREGFLAIAPPFTGDILWEHLEILQKGKYYCEMNLLRIGNFASIKLQTNNQTINRTKIDSGSLPSSPWSHFAFIIIVSLFWHDINHCRLGACVIFSLFIIIKNQKCVYTVRCTLKRTMGQWRLVQIQWIGFNLSHLCSVLWMVSVSVCMFVCLYACLLCEEHCYVQYVVLHCASRIAATNGIGKHFSGAFSDALLVVCATGRHAGVLCHKPYARWMSVVIHSFYKTLTNDDDDHHHNSDFQCYSIFIFMVI